MGVNGTRLTDGVAELHCALTDFPSGVRVRLHQRRRPALVAALSVFAPCRLALLLGVHATLRTARPLGESTLYYQAMPSFASDSFPCCDEHQHSPPGF